MFGRGRYDDVPRGARKFTFTDPLRNLQLDLPCLGRTPLTLSSLVWLLFVLLGFLWWFNLHTCAFRDYAAGSRAGSC